MSRPPSATRWILLTLAGLVVGLPVALLASVPLEAVVGMMLVTPLMTMIAGAIVGGSQWLELRRHFERSAGWIAACAVGLGIGLAGGTVLVEAVSEWLTGQPLRMATSGIRGVAVGVLAIGAFGGAGLGVAQMWFLRRHPVRRVAIVGASTLGMSLGFLVGGLLGHGLFGLPSPLGIATLLVVAGATLGAMTFAPIRGALARVPADGN